MSKPFINNDSVVNNISDDGIYIRELVEREKRAGLNSLKQAHLGRLVTVFCYNSLEAYKNVIVREEGLHQRELAWEIFLKRSSLTPYFDRIVAHEAIGLHNLDNALAQVEGLKALRDFISHGLTDQSAIGFERKISALKLADLLKNPQNLQLADIDRILDLDSAITALMGMGRALKTATK